MSEIADIHDLSRIAARPAPKARQLLWRHTELQLLMLIRSPSYLVSTVAFPALFFLLFAAPNAHGELYANLYLVTFAAFGVLSVALFQFGVQTAQELDTPWEQFMRSLPVKSGIRVVARALTALLFSLIATMVVAATAIATTSVRLHPGQTLSVELVLVVGSLPFVFLGLSLAYWARPTLVVPIANLIYLPLAFVGLWGRSLPGSLAVIGTYLPTRAWVRLTWAPVLGRAWPWHQALLLAGWGILFAVVALAGFMRRRADRGGQ